MDFNELFQRFCARQFAEAYAHLDEVFMSKVTDKFKKYILEAVEDIKNEKKDTAL